MNYKRRKNILIQRKIHHTLGGGGGGGKNKKIVHSIYKTELVQMLAGIIRSSTDTVSISRMKSESMQFPSY